MDASAVLRAQRESFYFGSERVYKEECESRWVAKQKADFWLEAFVL